MGFLRVFGSLIDRLFVVAGAFIGSQVPEFMNQYTQRLSGHVAELDHLLQNLRQAAAFSNKTLEQYIQKFLTNSDPDFSHQGEFMQTMLTRWQDLSLSLQKMTESSMWSRPYVFFNYLNYDIAKSTLASYNPGLSLTIEGLCYTGMGLVIGFLIYQSLAKCLQMGSNRVVTLFKQTV